MIDILKTKKRRDIEQLETKDIYDALTEEMKVDSVKAYRGEMDILDFMHKYKVNGPMAFRIINSCLTYYNP